MAAPSIPPRVIRCSHEEAYRVNQQISHNTWRSAHLDRYVQFLPLEQNKSVLSHGYIDLGVIKTITRFMKSHINQLPFFPHCYEVIECENSKSYKVTFVLDKTTESIQELHINSKNPIRLYPLGSYLKTWLVALRSLHSKGFVHNSITPLSLTKQHIIDYFHLNHSTVQDLESSSTTSRSYQAPEVILSLDRACSLDMWGLGATLFKLYTGEDLAPIKETDNSELDDLVHLHVLEKRCQKKFPKEMFKHSTLYNYNCQELWKITLDDSMEKTETLKDAILRSAIKIEIDGVALAYFLDFLEKCLTFDPNKRITANEALKHPFIEHLSNQELSRKRVKDRCTVM